MAFIESLFMFGAFTYVGADLHLRFGVSFTLVGLFVGAFAIGGLIYSLSVRRLVNRLGQIGLVTAGGVMLAPRLRHARLRAERLSRAVRHHRDRAWLLHAAQHAADQRHADDAGSARHRGGDFLVRALSRADRSASPSTD